MISKKKMNDIIKTITSLDESCLLKKGVSKTIKGASLLGNLMIDKGVKVKIPGWGVIRAGEETTREIQDF